VAPTNVAVSNGYEEDVVTSVTSPCATWKYEGPPNTTVSILCQVGAKALDQNRRLTPVEDDILRRKSTGENAFALNQSTLENQPIREALEDTVASIGRQTTHIVNDAQEDSERTDRISLDLLIAALALALVVIATLSVLLRRAMQQLSAIRNRLEDAVTLQQRVMGVVCHDLRSPLSVILMTASALSRVTNKPPTHAAAVERIARNARRMEHLIGSLMDVTKLQTGLEFVIIPQPGDIHDMVEHLVTDARIVHGDRIIEHRKTGDGQGCLDFDRAAEVVTNLIDNAVRYSPCNSPVRVATSGSPTELKIEIHNAGHIPPDLMGRIFDPFQRGMAQPSSRFSAGLGLYVAKKIAKAEGGEIEVRSNPDEGTNFCVRLPRSFSPQLNVMNRPVGVIGAEHLLSGH
jgi:signal transduction histidine kinase